MRRCALALPPEFQDVSCWWQFTSGAGIKPGIRMRLAYWLDRPLGGRDLKRWLPDKPVDQSVPNPVQPIYVGWPIFMAGRDPVPVRSGIFRAGRDTVAVPSVLEPAGGADDAPRLGYAAWCSLVGDHPGGKGFHDPIKSAIAAWIGKHGAQHPTTWLRGDIERVIRNADRSAHNARYIEEKVAQLDALIAWTVEREAQKPPRQSQSAEAAAIAAATEMFHTPDGDGFVDIEVGGHRESHPIRSKAFKQWISFTYYTKHGKPPASDALEQTLVLTEGKARYEAPEREAHLRVAQVGEKLYLDLADDRWRAVEVDARGWRVVDRPPVRFRRTAGMLPLPAPRDGGSVDDLKGFLNVDANGFVLAVAWQLAALGGIGPYPSSPSTASTARPRRRAAGTADARSTPPYCPREAPRDPTATCSSPHSIRTSSTSRTYRRCRSGSATPCAAWPRGAGSPRASSTRTPTKCCFAACARSSLTG